MSVRGFRRQITSRFRAWRAIDQGDVAITDIVLGASSGIDKDPQPDLGDPAPILRAGVVYDPKGNANVMSGLHGDRANAEIFIEVWGVHHWKPGEFSDDRIEERELYAAISLNNGGRLFVLPRRKIAYISSPAEPRWRQVGKGCSEQLSNAVAEHMIFGNQDLSDMAQAVTEVISPSTEDPPYPNLLQLPSRRVGGNPDQRRAKRWMQDFTEAAGRELEHRKSKHRHGEFWAMQGVYGSKRELIDRYREYLETRYGPVKDGWDQGLAGVVIASGVRLAAETDIFAQNLPHVTELLRDVPVEFGIYGAIVGGVVYSGKKTVDTVRILKRRQQLRGELAAGNTGNLPHAVGIPEAVEPVTSGVNHELSAAEHVLALVAAAPRKPETKRQRLERHGVRSSWDIPRSAGSASQAGGRLGPS